MPLPFARTASAVARPTFSRDFAGLKTLDHGVGPSITFTRGSNATYFDAAGTLTTATTNEPRFDHNPSTGASLGLLIEESRTNSIRNSQAGGATNGVIGSGGALPTNWTFFGSSGLAGEVLASGTLIGFDYVDVKLSGTNTSGSTGQFTIGFESPTQIVASNGQTWTGSVYAALVGGSLTNVTSISVETIERSVTGTYLTGTSASIASATSSLQRFSSIRTFNQATVERTTHRVVANIPNNGVVDFTLRIAAPQLEQGAFPTSYIPTTTAAATRAADSAVVTPISSFYNQSEGTLFGEAIGVNNIDSAVTRRFAEISDADNSRLLIGYNTLAQSRFRVISGGSDQADVTVARTMGGALARIAGAYSANDFQQATNGTLGTADSSGSPPQVSRLNIGTAFAVDKESAINGHIRKIAYWPKRLTNALLQQLTT